MTNVTRLVLLGALGVAGGALLGWLIGRSSTPGNMHLASVSADSEAGMSSPAYADSSGRIGSGPVPSTPALLLDSLTIDLEQDGETERVELYVDSERDESGEIMWDDGHRWMLLVRSADGDRAHTLFDGRVTLGHLGFWAVERAEGDAAAIVVLQDAGAGVVVESYLYEPASSAFVREGRVSVSGNVTARPQRR